MAPQPTNSPHILAETVEAVRWLTIHRPSRKNALSTGMYAALADELEAASTDPAVRCVAIMGSEGVFSSGNDVMDFQQNPPTLSDDAPVIRFLRALVACDKPLVAGVDGAAVGVGTTLLLHCDLVYLSDRARLRLPFVNLGLVPEAGSSLLLPLVAGHQRAAELLLLGDFFSAQTALACGMANGVVAPEALTDAVAATCKRLADQPARSIRQTRRLLRAPLRAQLERVMHEEAELFLSMLTAPEAIEAFTAFFEKRSPDFRQFS